MKITIGWKDPDFDDSVNWLKLDKEVVDRLRQHLYDSGFREYLYIELDTDTGSVTLLGEFYDKENDLFETRPIEFKPIKLEVKP